MLTWLYRKNSSIWMTMPPPRSLAVHNEYSFPCHLQFVLWQTLETLEKIWTIPCGCTEILWFSIPCNSGTARWKTPFQSYILEQHKNYWMMLETLKSIQGNLSAPLFARGTFCDRLRIACTEALAAELMNVSRWWNLNEQKVEELLCLLVFVGSPRSERWPR